jgi:hypothetical protein
MEKRYYIIGVYIGLIILSSLELYGAAPGGSGGGYGSTDFYTNNHPSTWDYDRVQWEYVPENRIPEVPKDKLMISKLNDNQLKKVTTDQLLYKDNYDRVADKSKLDPDVRDDVLQKHSGRRVQTRMSGPTKGGFVDGGFWFDTIDFLKVEDTTINNGVNVKFEKNRITFDRADSVINKWSSTNQNTISTNVNLYDGSPDSFYVESAERVQVNCLTLEDVRESTFQKGRDIIYINPSTGVTLYITDCAGTEATYNASENSGIAITEKEPITYTLNNGTLIYDSDDYTEQLYAEDYATVKVDFFDGFECMDISPVGTYFYSDKLDKRKDFAIHIPDYGDYYSLCIRRLPEQEFGLECANCGVIDFVNERISLNGIVDYLRYNLKDNELSSVMLNNSYQGFVSPKTRFLIKDFIIIDEALIELETPPKTATLTIPSTYYKIKEKAVNNSVHTLIRVDFGLISEDLTDNLIVNYKTNYLTDLQINNNLLTQRNIKILPPQHVTISNILQ